ncbi:acetate--CoA ligase family protein [Rothia sp. ARF10]|nr:acetate--CoA ligase family protein [Rothia sp. ARF10]
MNVQTASVADAPDTTASEGNPMLQQLQRTLADNLLRPRSVAIVGASDDRTKTTARPLQFLRAAGFEGAVYPVNPSRATVLGEQAWPSLDALPEVPDHVYVLTNAEPAIETVRECGRLGVPMVTILASGFGEEGPEGEERQARLQAAAREGGVRLVGPSSLGVTNPRTGMLLTANAAFAEEGLPEGDVFVASQSGSVIGALLSRGKTRGLGFAGLVSVGGEADLSIGELCEATLDDPGIGSYALFLESLQHSHDLASFAHAAHAAGKPVAVYKLGRSEEAAALSVSHTGALAGADVEADAFLAACGFARVDHLEALIEAPPLLARLGDVAGRTTARVGVITTTGGGAAVVVDQLATRGVSVVAPSSATLEAMTAAGCPVSPSLIVDLTLAGAKHELVRSAVSIMQDSGEFDLVLFVIGSSARSNPELAVRAIAECADGATPVAAFALPDALATLELLHHSGVPAFRTPEACADAVAAALNRRVPTVARTWPTPDAEGAVVLDEVDSGQVLQQQGVPVVPGEVVAVERVAEVAGSLPVSFPVAVKALSSDLPHKSDAGGVVLGVADADGVVAAVHSIVASVRKNAPEVTLDSVLVQEMATPGVADTLVGYRVSPSVGPVVVLAAGGVLTELYQDSTMRLAPVDEAEARAMIGEVRALGQLHGFRGGPRGDVSALVSAIVAVSRLAIDRPDVVEAEMNPLSVRTEGHGVVALDALVRVASVGEESTTTTTEAGLP